MKKYSIGISLAVILAGLVWWSIAAKNKKNEAFQQMSSREMALQQTTDMATKYHIHPELTILVDGKNIAIPHNLGVNTAGMTSLHTHDEEGVIHVESPIQKDFTLGDFFAVWKKDFYSFGSKARMTVNGVENNQLENYVMRDHDKIILYYQ